MAILNLWFLISLITFLRRGYVIILISTLGTIFLGGGRSNDPHTIQLRTIPPSNRLAPLQEYMSMKYLIVGGQMKFPEKKSEIICKNVMDYPWTKNSFKIGCDSINLSPTKRYSAYGHTERSSSPLVKIVLQNNLSRKYYYRCRGTYRKGTQAYSECGHNGLNRDNQVQLN